MSTSTLVPTRSSDAMTEDRPQDGDDSDLNPPFTGTGLPAEIAQLREMRTAEQKASRQRWEPRINAHIHAHRLALDFLAETHQWVADTYDFDLVGDTRPAAMWQMSGRCVGIGRLILDSLQLGYTAEVLHLGRAVHETNRLLATFHMEGEDAILCRWLQGEYVRPAEAREAEERFDKLLAETLHEKGIEGDPVKTREGLSRVMYGRLSEAAHHRRRWTEDAVFPDERIMLVGRTENWTRRAATTGTLVSVVEEIVISVGDALSQFIPNRGWHRERVKPFIETFAALRATQPLV